MRGRFSLFSEFSGEIDATGDYLSFGVIPMSIAAFRAVRRAAAAYSPGLRWRVYQTQGQIVGGRGRVAAGDSRSVVGGDCLIGSAFELQSLEYRIGTARAHSRAGEEAAGSSSSSAGQGAGTGVGQDAVGGETFVDKVGRGVIRATSTAAAAFRRVKDAKVLDVAKDGYAFLKEELTSTGPRKRPSGPPAPTVAPDTSATAIVNVRRKKTAWEERWDDVKSKAQGHPLFKKLSKVKQHPVVTRGQEIAEDIRETWETSDSPVVHKIQDLNESMFGETATAMAIREIRKRDPTFSYPDFISEVQKCVRPVLQAYLKGDTEALKNSCSESVLIRCGAETKALRTMGWFLDNKILHVSDVQVKETKLLGNEPVIIVSFHTQQINCARDQAGNIVEGAKDDIHTVYYLWAMEHVFTEETLREGSGRWQLREMQKLGMQALI